jgi:hypothetical protein
LVLEVVLLESDDPWEEEASADAASVFFLFLLFVVSELVWLWSPDC